MKTRLILAAALVALVGWLTLPPGTAQEPLNLPRGVEVVIRGPVHEAFAEPAEAVAQEFLVIPRRPPEPIEELPPEERPAGDEVVWIPGYWAWDEESSNFLWVSGTWREEPPNRHWVPGFWQEVEGGWHRVSGFWASDQTDLIQYTPPPPEPIPESVPPAPNAESVYVPGTWVYADTRYLWRPGYYVAYQPGWVYIPARYYWTPGGYVFVDGYWDYPLHQRGLLFAPLRWNANVAVTSFRYVPTYAINPDILVTSLFVRPATRTYYFGDYFENKYTLAGYTPWYDFQLARGVRDPNFAYYYHTFRDNRQWETDLRNLYTGRMQGRVARPPRTIAEQTQMLSSRSDTTVTNITNLRVAAPLTQINNMRLTLGGAVTGDAVRATTATGATTVRLQPVAQDARRYYETAVRNYRTVAEQRREGELRLTQGDGLRTGERAQALRVDVPRRTQQPGVRAEGRRTPPPPPRVPQPDARGVERPREARPADERPRTERPGVGSESERPKPPPVERPRDINVPPRPGDPPKAPPPVERPRVEPPASERPRTQPPVTTPGRPSTQPPRPIRPGAPDRPRTEPPTTPERPRTERPPTVPPTIPDRPKTERPPTIPPTVPDRPKTERPPTVPPVRPEVPGRPVPPERPKAELPPNVPPDRPRTEPPRPTPPERPKAEPPRPAPERPKAEPPRPAPERPKAEPPRPTPPDRPRPEPPAKDRSKDKDKGKDGKDGGR